MAGLPKTLPRYSHRHGNADLQRRQNANAFATSIGQTSVNALRHPGLPHGVNATLSMKPTAMLESIIVVAQESSIFGQPWLLHASFNGDSVWY